MKKNEVKKNNKGFSLVELIVVIAIMAVLVGVLAPQFIRYVERSRQSTDVQNADQVATALKTYFADQEDASDSTVTIKHGAAPATDTNSANALSQAGLSGVQLKSSKWTSNIVVTYHASSGQTTVSGAATYYKADGSKV